METIQGHLTVCLVLFFLLLFMLFQLWSGQIYSKYGVFVDRLNKPTFFWIVWITECLFLAFAGIVYFSILI